MSNTSIGLSSRSGDRLWRVGWYALFALLPFGHTALGLLIILTAMIVIKVRRAEPPGDAGARPELMVAVDWTFRIFLGWIVVSAALSPKPLVALPLTLGYMLVIWVFAFGGRRLGSDPDPLGSLLLILAVSGTLSAATILSRLILLGLPRASLLITGPNGTGTLLILVIGLGMGYLLTRRSPIYLVAPFIIAMTSALLATKSRGAWLGFLVMLGASALTNRRSTAVVTIIALLFGAALMVVPGLGPRFLSAFDLGRNESRILIFEATFKMIRDYPIQGVGAGVYQHVYDQYKLPGWRKGPAAYAHNLFLQVAAEFGLVGLAFFVCLLGLLLLMGWRLARLGDPRYTWLFGSFLGVLVHQQVDVPIWAMDIGGAFWLMIGITTGLFWHEWRAGRVSGALPFGIGRQKGNVARQVG